MITHIYCQFYFGIILTSQDDQQAFTLTRFPGRERRAPGLLKSLMTAFMSTRYFSARVAATRRLHADASAVNTAAGLLFKVYFPKTSLSNISKTSSSGTHILSILGRGFSGAAALWDADDDFSDVYGFLDAAENRMWLGVVARYAIYILPIDVCIRFTAAHISPALKPPLPS